MSYTKGERAIPVLERLYFKKPLKCMDVTHWSARYSIYYDLEDRIYSPEARPFLLSLGIDDPTIEWIPLYVIDEPYLPDIRIE